MNSPTTRRILNLLALTQKGQDTRPLSTEIKPINPFLHLDRSFTPAPVDPALAEAAAFVTELEASECRLCIALLKRGTNPRLNIVEILFYIRNMPDSEVHALLTSDLPIFSRYASHGLKVLEDRGLTLDSFWGVLRDLAPYSIPSTSSADYLDHVGPRRTQWKVHFAGAAPVCGGPEHNFQFRNFPQEARLGRALHD